VLPAAVDAAAAAVADWSCQLRGPQCLLVLPWVAGSGCLCWDPVGVFCWKTSQAQTASAPGQLLLVVVSLSSSCQGGVLQAAAAVVVVVVIAAVDTAHLAAAAAAVPGRAVGDLVQAAQLNAAGRAVSRTVRLSLFQPAAASMGLYLGLAACSCWPSQADTMAIRKHRRVAVAPCIDKHK